MSKCIPVNNGILCLSDTDFKCPACGRQYTEKDYSYQLENSKRGFIYKRCKKCASRIGITTDYMGDVQVWLKSEEKLNEKKES